MPVTLSGKVDGSYVVHSLGYTTVRRATSRHLPSQNTTPWHVCRSPVESEEMEERRTPASDATSAATALLLLAALCVLRAHAVRSAVRRSPPPPLHWGALACPAPAVPARWAVHGEAKGAALPARTAVPVRWAVCGEMRPPDEVAACVPAKGVTRKKNTSFGSCVHPRPPVMHLARWGW